MKKMDSVKVFNGYGNLNNLEDQSAIHSNNTIIKNRKNSFITVITISCIFILTLIIGTIIIALFHVSNTEKESKTEPLSSDLNSSDSLKLLCNATRYPNKCFTSISSINTVSNSNSNSKPDPVSVFKMSLKISITELSSVSSFIETLNPDAALKDCDDLLSDAVSQLNDSAAVIDVVGVPLTEKMIDDMRTWVSAALTDQETCTDELEEMKSTAATEVKKRLEKSKEYVSNTLAILANIHLLPEKFGITFR